MNSLQSDRTYIALQDQYCSFTSFWMLRHVWNGLLRSPDRPAGCSKRRYGQHTTLVLARDGFIIFQTYTDRARLGIVASSRTFRLLMQKLAMHGSFFLCERESFELWFRTALSKCFEITSNGERSLEGAISDSFRSFWTDGKWHAGV